MFIVFTTGFGARLAVTIIYCSSIMTNRRITEMTGQTRFVDNACCPNVNPRAFDILVFRITYLM